MSQVLHWKIAMPELAVDLDYVLEEDRDYVVSRARDRDNRFFVRRAEEAVIGACTEGNRDAF